MDAARAQRNPVVHDRGRLLFARTEAQEHQRREQQGLGKAILSTEFQGYRVVAVGNTIHYSKQWGTFHDFLRHYPQIVFGKGWWMGEVAKQPEDRHRIVAWFLRAHEGIKEQLASTRLGQAIPSKGAMTAYMHFAYDLYALKHEQLVQQVLIDRIKSPDNFPGALYEVCVAAALLRAGFHLQLQDESDRRSTHVEFIATHQETGASYSVEAKRREGKRLKINRQMYRALSKHSDHPGSFSSTPTTRGLTLRAGAAIHSLSLRLRSCLKPTRETRWAARFRPHT
ncbi:hypothetical protein [Roseateles sp.]|uniref:hypothetical protein n=1 Tax=Roseateles sp. TaxID=1971397 RepID=UPI0031D481B4